MKFTTCEPTEFYTYFSKPIYDRVSDSIKTLPYHKRPIWHRVYPLFPPLSIQINRYKNSNTLWDDHSISLKTFDFIKRREVRLRKKFGIYEDDIFSQIVNLDNKVLKNDETVSSYLLKNPKIQLKPYSFSNDNTNKLLEPRNSHTFTLWSDPSYIISLEESSLSTTDEAAVSIKEE